MVMTGDDGGDGGDCDGIEGDVMVTAMTMLNDGDDEAMTVTMIWCRR